MTYETTVKAIVQGADFPMEAAPEIHQAEARLAEAVGSLDVALNELESRLERVLRYEPAEPMPGGVEASKEMVRPKTAPLTDFLTAQSARVEAEVSRVSDFLRRLAL